MRQLYIFPYFAAKTLEDLKNAGKAGFSIVHTRVIFAKNGPVIWAESDPPGKTDKRDVSQHFAEELREMTRTSEALAPAPKLADFLQTCRETRMRAFLESRFDGGLQQCSNVLERYADRVVITSDNPHLLEWASFQGYDTCAIVTPDSVTSVEYNLEIALGLKPKYVAIPWEHITRTVSDRMKELRRDVPLIAIIGTPDPDPRAEHHIYASTATGVFTRRPLDYVSRLGYIAA